MESCLVRTTFHGQCSSSALTLTTRRGVRSSEDFIHASFFCAITAILRCLLRSLCDRWASNEPLTSLEALKLGRLIFSLQLSCQPGLPLVLTTVRWARVYTLTKTCKVFLVQILNKRKLLTRVKLSSKSSPLQQQSLRE